MTLRDTGSPAWHIVMHRARGIGAVIRTEPGWLNIIGVRSPNRVAGRFDDAIHLCVYGDDGNLWHAVHAATLDPGTHYSERGNLLNPHGVARVVAGWYPGLWRVGTHRGYKAFQQAGPVTVARENDGDHIHGNDPTPVVQTGMFGINGHASTSDPWSRDVVRQDVGRWSAGCQVWQDSAEFRAAIGLAEAHIARGYGNSFGYALLEDG